MDKTDLGSIGSKRHRFCVIQKKKVRCHGVCRGAFANSEETEVIMCPVYVKSFDSVVNC